MKTKISSMILISSLATLIGCGAKEKSVKLEVSATMALSASGFTGGLIAYGEGPNGEKFSASSAAGQNVNATIIDGTWKIYVMGWEEGSNLKFRGTKYCGMSTVNLGSTDANVNIQISSANCADPTHPFNLDTVQKDLLISSCGAFYKYDEGNDDFQTLTSADPDIFCSDLPSNLQSRPSYYKITSLNRQGASILPGIQSECLTTYVDPTDANNTRLSIPTRKFPFQVNLYRSLKDCQNTANPRFYQYQFLNGIEQGQQASFDHLFHIAANKARLFLPSSITRRGYSPFMHLLPRVLCGTAPSLIDCFSAPDLPNLVASPYSEIQFDVPWDEKGMKNEEGVALIKKFATTNTNGSCPNDVTQLLNSHSNFGLKSCEIRNGDVIGTLARNIFTCRASPSDIPGIVDLYERNGLIYLVHTLGTDHKVLIFNTKGILQGNVELPANPGSYESMATDSSGNIYVLINTGGSNRAIHKFTFNPSTKSYSHSQFDNGTYSLLTDINRIEITDNNTLVTATVDQLRAISLSNLNPNPVPTPITVPGNTPGIKKLLFKNNFLYFLTHSDTNTYSNVFDSSISGTSITIGNSGSPRFSSSNLHKSFHISTINSNRFIAMSPIQISSPYYLKVYPMDSNNDIDTGNGTSLMVSALGSSILMTSDMIYTLEGANFISYKFDTISNPSSLQLAQLTSGTCEGEITGSINGTNYSLIARSSNSNNAKIIFDEALRFAGLRTLLSENSITYFDSLNNDHFDEVRTGGLLGRAEEMLGPNGLGGVINAFYPGQTCQQIKNALPPTGSDTRTISLYELEEGVNRSFTIALSKPATQVQDYICDSGPCSDNYDITINLTDGTSGDSEKMRLQLRCADKIGSLESIENKDGEIRRELLLWNTKSLTNTRIENYQISDYTENSENHTWVSVSKLEKSKPLDDMIEARALDFHRNSISASGSVREFYLADVTGQKIMTSALHTGSVNLDDFEPNNGNFIGAVSIGDMISNTTLDEIFTDAGACMIAANSTVTYSPITCNQQSFTFPSLSMSNEVDFTLESLKTNTDESTPYFYDIFSLTP